MSIFGYTSGFGWRGRRIDLSLSSSAAAAGGGMMELKLGWIMGDIVMGEAFKSILGWQLVCHSQGGAWKVSRKRWQRWFSWRGRYNQLANQMVCLANGEILVQSRSWSTGALLSQTTFFAFMYSSFILHLKEGVLGFFVGLMLSCGSPARASIDFELQKCPYFLALVFLKN